MAKKEGFRSRAVYKLKQIDQKFNLFTESMKVVDLGAAPGGWIQYASERVGNGGFVLGVDIKRIEPLPYSNTKTIELDISRTDAADIVLNEAGGKADLVLSDLSPHISGVWEVDVIIQAELCRSAIRVTGKTLKKKGSMVLKSFMGKEMMKIISELKSRFVRINIYRPPTTRKRSAEIYIVCKGFKRDASSTAFRKS